MKTASQVSGLLISAWAFMFMATVVPPAWGQGAPPGLPSGDSIDPKKKPDGKIIYNDRGSNVGRNENTKKDDPCTYAVTQDKGKVSNTGKGPDCTKK